MFFLRLEAVLGPKTARKVESRAKFVLHMKRRKGKRRISTYIEISLKQAASEQGAKQSAKPNIKTTMAWRHFEGHRNT